MSIEHLRYFKLCSESITTVKKAMHHRQLEKHGPRLENILTHNRSPIKNDIPLMVLTVLCMSGGCSLRHHFKTGFVLWLRAALLAARQNQLF